MKFPYTMGMGRLSVNQCVTTPCSMISTAIPCFSADPRSVRERWCPRTPGCTMRPSGRRWWNAWFVFFSRCALNEEGSMWLKQSQTIPPITINSRDKSIPKLQITIGGVSIHPQMGGLLFYPKCNLFFSRSYIDIYIHIPATSLLNDISKST